MIFKILWQKIWSNMTKSNIFWKQVPVNIKNEEDSFDYEWELKEICEEVEKIICVFLGE